MPDGVQMENPQTRRIGSNGTPVALGGEILGIVSRLRDTMQERQDKFLEMYPSCPGTCDDGLLRIPEDSGAMLCPYKSSDCGYARQARKKMYEFLVNTLCAHPIPAVHRQRLLAPQPSPAVEAVRRWDWEKKPFLLLFGEKGTGKSFAAACAYMRYCLAQADDLWDSPNSWISWAKTCASRLAWLHIYRLASERDAPSEALNAPFLILDDLATEDATSQTKARINYVISSKYDSFSPMIITGNFSYAEFVERYGERIADRIQQYGELVHCTGTNLRHESR